MNNTNAREIVIIDAGVADWKTLTAGISPAIYSVPDLLSSKLFNNLSIKITPKNIKR